MAERVEVHRREDGKYGWRKIARNENIVATDGGQGYSRLIDAVGQAKKENEGVPVYVIEVEEKEPVVPEPVPPPEDDAA